MYHCWENLFVVHTFRLSLQRGDRSQNIVVFITDGRANNPTLARQEAELLRNERGAYIFGIGVSNQIFESELQTYTSLSQRRNTNYWLVNSYNDLGRIVDTLGNGVCTYVEPTPGMRQRHRAIKILFCNMIYKVSIKMS